MKAAVQERIPKGSDEYLYMELFDQLPSRDDLGSVFVFDYHGSLKESTFPSEAQPYKIVSTKFQNMTEAVKMESSKNGPPINSMVIRSGDHTKHTECIFCFVHYKTHSSYGNFYCEINSKELTNSLNKHVDQTILNSKPNADIPQKNKVPGWASFFRLPGWRRSRHWTVEVRMLPYTRTSTTKLDCEIKWITLDKKESN